MEQTDQALVSVVMVVCNADRFLAEAIESILAQTYKGFEFIIIDFGSADKSKEIAAHYAAQDGRIRLLEIPHCSLPEARNAGCFLAQGKYIAVVDADDISVPNRLLWETEFMEEHAEVGAVGGAVEWINAAGEPLQTARHALENREIQIELLTHSVLWHPTVLLRSSAFRQVGGYRAAFPVAHDYDLWLRIAEHFQLANLEQVVLKYRIHPHQLSFRRRKQQTLCVLAAQESASSRRGGRPDPLDSVQEVRSETLVTWGVTKARQQNVLAEDYRDWVRNICVAGEYPVAIEAVNEILRSDLRYVDRWRVADFYQTLAKLYWRQHNVMKSAFAMVRAVMARPMMIGRPLKPMLERLGLT